MKKTLILAAIFSLSASSALALRAEGDLGLEPLIRDPKTGDVLNCETCGVINGQRVKPEMDRSIAGVQKSAPTEHVGDASDTPGPNVK